MTACSRQALGTRRVLLHNVSCRLPPLHVLLVEDVQLVDGALHLLLLQLPQLSAPGLRDGHVDRGHKGAPPRAALVNVFVAVSLCVGNYGDRELGRVAAGPDLRQVQPGRMMHT